MDLSYFIPNEVWHIIMNFMRFQNILIFRGVTERFKTLATIRIEETEKIVKSAPNRSIYLPNYTVVGTPLNTVNILWMAKDGDFNHPVNDQQTRNANRGLGFVSRSSGESTDLIWVWVRGPFISGIRKENFICIYQEDHLYNLTRHLKKYEVEFMSRFVDKMKITCKVEKGNTIWVGIPPEEEPKKKETCIIS